MSSCCDSPDVPLKRGVLTVALAGNPNCGKTTLFNALTGLRQKVANYPGVTVEKKTGRCWIHEPNGDGGCGCDCESSADPRPQSTRGSWINIIDLPGTYSLISRSPDELVAMEVLRGLRKDTPPPDAVIVVVDASNLQRNLYLVSQLIELGRPLVVALNMMDVAARRGINISPQSLQEQLGVPVIPIVGHKRRGIDALKQAIAKAAVAPMPDWPLPVAMKEELALVGGGLAIMDSDDNEPPVPMERYQALAERLLIGDRAADIEPFARQEPVSSLLSHATSRLQQLGLDPMQADIEAHYHWIDTVAAKALVPACEALLDPAFGSSADAHPPSKSRAPLQSPDRKRSLTDRVDRILVHKVWGLLIFALIMGALFLSIFWLAAPIMDGITDAITAFGVWVGAMLPAGPINALVTDGIIAGVGAVVVFVPQIALLFLFLAILEDSGYLARAAFLMDRLLSKVGLHGKSFIPLLSSFACAIPGIMATRTIEDRKSRLATILVAPFMSCSARLPVYTLLIGAFFATSGALTQAGIMLACYALGIIAAAGTAWLFKRAIMRGPTPAFILELPTYKVPQVGQIGRQVWTNTMAFLTKAGTTIFCLSVILWAMTYYPRLSPSQVDEVVAQARIAVPADLEAPIAAASVSNEASVSEPADASASAVEPADAVQAHIDEAVASSQLRQSIAGRLGHLMEPAIRPLGFDWKMGIGLVGAFAAREVFVSTMAITYGAGGGDDTLDLSSAMQKDTYTTGARAGQPVWTPLVAISLLVWFVLAMQCMSTLAVVRRETGGWAWPMFMLIYMTGLAYVLSLAVYQIGSLVLRG